MSRPSRRAPSCLALFALLTCCTLSPVVAGSAFADEHLGHSARPAVHLAPVAALPVTVAFGKNIIVNAGAEDSLASPDGYVPVSVPGWTTSGPATSIAYASSGGGFPTLSDRGPVGRGMNLFAGGNATPASWLSQTIDVSGLARVVDGGGVTFRFCGYLGGFSSQEDDAVASAVFLAAGGGALDSTAIGPVTAGDRASATGLVYRQSTGTVPTLTRSVRVTIRFVRAAGTYDDGYADSLGLQLDPPAHADVGAASTPELALVVAPNPVRDGAALTFASTATGSVRVDVLDLAGRHVATLADGVFGAGTHVVHWSRGTCRPGVYLVRLSTPAGTVVRRIVTLQP